jgi:hypothetical protein
MISLSMGILSADSTDCQESNSARNDGIGLRVQAAWIASQGAAARFDW